VSRGWRIAGALCGMIGWSCGLALSLVIVADGGGWHGAAGALCAAWSAVNIGLYAVGLWVAVRKR
jgi:hypothetical protein